RPGTRAFAEPGRLLTGVLEPSRQGHTPGKAWDQVKIDSVETARTAELVEVIAAPNDWAAEPRDLIARDRPLAIEHPPLEQAYVSWQGHLYGPLRATTSPDDGGAWRVHFSTVNADHSVMKIPEAGLGRLPAAGQHHLHVAAPLSDVAPDRIAGT